ncbi:MAG: ABC transporter permease [Candidatus Protochlamydia sp.]|nr:ABC transporter permease [Candidatus Protochlamydia sp.]
MVKKSGRLYRAWTSILQASALIEADLRKLRHDPFELITRMIQPIIWLLIFGQAMAKVRAIPIGENSYLDFMAPGILAQSVLFVGIFYGISLIWERDIGILQKILVSPVPRVILILARGISGGIRSLSQVFIIYALSFFLGIHLRFDVFALLGVCAMVMLGGAIFSTFSLTAAAIVKKRERFMGIGQVLTMPLFFASNALYPINLMPDWLKTLSLFNPLTYQVDALRCLMIVDEVSHFGLGFDFGITLVVLCLALAIATPIYPRILY